MEIVNRIAFLQFMGLLRKLENFPAQDLFKRMNM